MLPEERADRRVTLFEDVVLLALLLRVVLVRQRRKRDVLPDRGDVRDAAAHVAGGLRLQRLELFGRGALEREGDEAHAQAPHVVLLRAAVQLDGEHVRVERGERGEERLAVDALLVDEPEVGVVEDDDDPLAGLGGGLDGGDNLRRVLQRRRVARGVVREIQDEDLLLPGAEQGRLEGVGVERAIPEGVESLDGGAARLLEDERVVVPVEIGNHHLVTTAGEEFGGDTQTVRKRVGDDGVRVGDALQRGVLLDL